MLHWLGFGLCHQLPVRSFFGGGVEFPVCARDTGIYIGFVTSMLIMATTDRGRRRSEMPRAWVLVLGGVFLALMGWDGVTSYAHWRSTTNEIRLITGLLAGYALPLVVVPLLNSSLWDRCSQDRVLADAKDVAIWLASIPVAFLVIWLGASRAGLFFPLLTAACIIVTFVSVNLVIAGLLPVFEQRASRLLALWPAVAAAAALSAVEIAGSAWLKLWVESLVRTR